MKRLQSEVEVGAALNALVDRVDLIDAAVHGPARKAAVVVVGFDRSRSLPWLKR